ncbi:MAG: aminoacyl-tRNA hydrolase [Treponema sp.]|jgi:ribosome-associated protein|nr:aminoacyl-tRNA hydrolase [Treponema sp.]
MNSALLRRVIREAAEVTYSHSGGPGGQNVNKVNTKATLRLRLGDLEKALSGVELDHIRELLASRITGADELIITSSEERSQRVNLERAFARMEALIAAAAKLPKRRRAAAGPSRAAQEKRLQSKRIRSRKKSLRHFSDGEYDGGH